MKRIPTFVAGMLTAAVIGALGVGALAASGAVTFNASNLQLNGQQISAKGENYTLANGQQVPASITYTDETGGGTTYLPVRRISELLGVETGWDSATGSVTVGEATQTPDTNFASTDYSKWSAEEEAAYQEFKGMWETSTGGGERIYLVFVKFVGTFSQEDVLAYLSAHPAYIERFAYELATSSAPQTHIEFYWGENQIANVLMLKKSIQDVYISNSR